MHAIDKINPYKYAVLFVQVTRIELSPLGANQNYCSESSFCSEGILTILFFSVGCVLGYKALDQSFLLSHNFGYN